MNLRGLLKSVTGGHLQAVDQNSRIESVAEADARELRMRACVCSIVVAGEGRGTGFLIGEDLVITNHHVVSDKEGRRFDPSDMKCRFGFFDEGEYEDGRHRWIDLPREPSMAIPAWSPHRDADDALSELAVDYRDPNTGEFCWDYAILQLTELVGQETGRTVLGEFRPLGWIRMEPTQPLKPGQELRIVQFPQREDTSRSFYSQETMQIAPGTFAEPVADGVRSRHTVSTRKGSSGAPVFDGAGKLVGLHNAGDEEKGVADNRFVPIDRILEDLRRRSPALHGRIVGTGPPPILRPRLSARDQAAVGPLVEAAKCFLDREREHNALIAELTSRQPGAVVTHLICRKDDDHVDLFIRRLQISLSRTEPASGDDLAVEYLCGRIDPTRTGLLLQPQSITWPDPLTPLDQARIEFAQALKSTGFKHALLTLYPSRLKDRVPSDEIAYTTILGEELKAYAERTRSSGSAPLQALVIYQSDRKTAPASAVLTPLWQYGSAPKHAGASVLLRKVARGQIEPWRATVNRAWEMRDKPIVIPDSISEDDELSMAELLKLLDGLIVEAALGVVRERFKEHR